MIAHVVIGMIGFELFGDRRASVRSIIPAISPNTATNIRNVKICCISISSSGKFYLHYQFRKTSFRDLYATYYHFRSVLTILF